MGKKKRAGGGKKTATAESTASGPPAPQPDERIDPAVLASVLAAEYPLIDPSLVHAILLDYDPATLGRHLAEIRDQLGILEATSVPDLDDEQSRSAFPPGSPELGPSETNDAPHDTLDTYETSMSGRASPFALPSALVRSTQSTDFGTAITSATSTSTSSASMCSDGDDPQTELELLSGFFPSLPQKCIREALASEPSLDAAIDHLLSVELIRGVQRSGVWPDEPEDDADAEQFNVAVRSRRGSSNSGHSRASIDSRTKTKPKKAATVTIPLVDTLQRRAAPPTRSGSASGSSTPRTPGVPPTDVWSAFASLAAFLADTLPRAQAPFFTSFLHSPDYTCAHEAVLAALSTLASSARVDALTDDATAIVEDIFGMSLSDEGAHELELCLRAAEGDVGVVMDLMDLLEELTWWPDYEAARDFGRDPFEQLAQLEKALPSPKTAVMKTAPLQAASEPQNIEPQEWTTTRVVNPNRLQRPKSEEPQKRERVVPGSRPTNGGFTAANPFAGLPRSARWAGQGSTPKGTVPWQTVAKAPRARAPRGSHRLAASIPAYARGMLPQDQRPGTLAAARALEASVPGHTTPAMCYERSNVEWRRREAAIRAAARHFKSGGRRDAAGAVAGHYAAQARAAGAAARDWELRGARLVIEAQMERSGHTVDLHYATVDQAVTLAVEAANRWWSAAEAERAANPGSVVRPLIVVTGKGQHSAGQRGVLGPAVAKALQDDGWRIERCEGYVAVKGRR